MWLDWDVNATYGTETPDIKIETPHALHHTSNHQLAIGVTGLPRTASRRIALMRAAITHAKAASDLKGPPGDQKKAALILSAQR